MMEKNLIMEKNLMRLLLASLPQVAKIASLLLLFLLAPLVPSSLRPPYLYLLFNALVVVLGVEAGFLTAISGPPRVDDRTRPTATAAPPSTLISKLPREVATVTNVRPVSRSNAAAAAATASPLEVRDAINHLADAAVAIPAAGAAAKKIIKKIKRCPSRASIFFIGSWDVDATVHEGEEEEEAGWTKQDAGGREEQLSKQELFTKAEAFIGNFYKQLKMQREESWKKLQDLYHHHHYKAKAF